jgi:hypothetical protein
MTMLPGMDISANYGMFSFSQKYFVLRFIFGLTDYQMGVMDTEDFLSEYREEGRWGKGTATSAHATGEMEHYPGSQ